MFKTPVTGFFIMLDRNLHFCIEWTFLLETITSGRTYIAFRVFKHFSALLLESILDHGWIIFKHDRILRGISRIYVGSL